MEKQYSIIMRFAMMVIAVSLTACGSETGDERVNFSYNENDYHSYSGFTIISDDGGWCNGKEIFTHVHYARFDYIPKNNKRVESRFIFSYDTSQTIAIIYRYRQYGTCITPNTFQEGYDSFRNSDVDIKWTNIFGDYEGEPVSGSAKVVGNNGQSITIDFDNYKILYAYGKHIQELTLIGRLSFDIDEKGDDSYINICPDDNHPHLIDLGTGIKWACCNVGAKSPVGYGGYYAWGETRDEHNYPYVTNDEKLEKKTSWGRTDFFENYSYYNALTGTFTNIGNEISGTQYDVAHVKWGRNYRMPTLSDYKSLLDKCSVKVEKINGITGMLFKGTNGKSLFFPCGGRTLFGVLIPSMYNTSTSNDGYYWSSTLSNNDAYAYLLYLPLYSEQAFMSNSEANSDGNRPMGAFVRPVSK